MAEVKLDLRAEINGTKLNDAIDLYVDGKKIRKRKRHPELTDLQILLVQTMYRDEGRSGPEIAAATGFPIFHVYRALSGIPKARPYGKVSEDIIDRIRTRLGQRIPVPKIAAELDLTGAKVRYIIRRYLND